MDDSRAMRSGVQTREILMTMHQRQRNPVPPAQPDPPDNLPADLAALSDADLRTLRLIWGSRWGAVPGLRSADLLRLLIAWRLQAEAMGGLDAQSRRALHRTGPVRAQGLELGPGTVLRRDWGGICHEVVVAETGFRWQGQVYPSLSQVARAITGTRWNGPRFFGLAATGTKGKAG